MSVLKNLVGDCGYRRKKMQKKSILILLFLGILLWGMAVVDLNGHSYRVPLIVDTDMALDDVRALVMLFNQDMADTLLVVTSDGVVSPELGARNLRKLLTLLGKKNIRIAQGRQLDKESPGWRG